MIPACYNDWNVSRRLRNSVPCTGTIGHFWKTIVCYYHHDPNSLDMRTGISEALSHVGHANDTSGSLHMVDHELAGFLAQGMQAQASLADHPLHAGPCKFCILFLLEKHAFLADLANCSFFFSFFLFSFFFLLGSWMEGTRRKSCEETGREALVSLLPGQRQDMNLMYFSLDI
jgi:hypothetical protein